MGPQLLPYLGAICAGFLFALIMTLILGREGARETPGGAFVVGVGVGIVSNIGTFPIILCAVLCMIGWAFCHFLYPKPSPKPQKRSRNRRNQDFD
jgi:hypothetical protein